MLKNNVDSVNVDSFIQRCGSSELSLLFNSAARDELLVPPRFECSNANVSFPDLPFDYVRQAVLSSEATSVTPRLSTALTSIDSVLRGKLIVVLGASSGIGAACAMALVERGALVAACARRVCKIDGAKSFRCDVTQASDVKRVINEAETAFGAQLYAVVNSAGVMYYEYMSTLDMQAWQTTIQTNCVGCVNTIGASLDVWKKRKAAGHLLFITSDAGRSAFDVGVFLFYFFCIFL